MLLISIDAHRPGDADAVRAVLDSAGADTRRVPSGPHELLVARVADGSLAPLAERVASMPGVQRAVPIDTPYVLSAREARAQRTEVRIAGDLIVGGPEFAVIAGPCSVESLEQTATVGRAVHAAGARALRGGAFKPRTSPFSFQGLREEGLEILDRVRAETGLPVVSELMSERDVETVHAAVDVLQVGMRNALNYALLKEIGRLPGRPPVLLKGGVGSTLDEILCAADYLLAEGNPNVILCLRGTVGFSHGSRRSLNVLDIAALRERTHLPIVVDPSHVAGRRDFVPALAAAALVAGADGLIVEVHHDPARALSDGAHSLTPRGFRHMMHRLRLLAPAMGRRMAAGVAPDIAPGAHPMDDLCLEAPVERPHRTVPRSAPAAAPATLSRGMVR